MHVGCLPEEKLSTNASQLILFTGWLTDWEGNHFTSSQPVFTMLMIVIVMPASFTCSVTLTVVVRGGPASPDPSPAQHYSQSEFTKFFSAQSSASPGENRLRALMATICPRKVVRSGLLCPISSVPALTLQTRQCQSGETLTTPPPLGAPHRKTGIKDAAPAFFLWCAGLPLSSQDTAVTNINMRSQRKIGIREITSSGPLHSLCSPWHLSNKINKSLTK